MTTSVSLSREIDAPAELVWGLVSDRGAVAKFFSKSASGVADRHAFTRESIETTLDNLAVAAEGDQKS